MSWRDRLLAASFRGIPFKVASHDHGVGRRNIVHQFPGADKPFIEDLGPDADTFTIEGYIVQNIGNGFDYFAERDALIDALRKEGPGTLVHPFLGEKRVCLAGQARIAENLSVDCGIARFTMAFVQYGERQLPELEIDQVATVDNAADDAINRIKDQFYDVYRHSSVSESDFVDSFKTGAGMAKKAILATRDVIGGKTGEIIQKINESIDSVNDVIAAGCSVGAEVVNNLSAFLDATGITAPIVNAVTGSCSGRLRGEVQHLEGDVIPNLLGVSMIRALKELVRYGESTDVENPSIYGGQLPTITINDYESAVKVANQNALVDITRNAAIANAIKIAARTEYWSYDECFSIVEEIAEAIDDELEDLANKASDTSCAEYGVSYQNDEHYSALEELRAQFIKSMKIIGGSLAKVKEYVVPPTALTALELAYDQYEDINRAQEIFERNQPIVEHPGLLPGGAILELLAS